MSLIDNEQVGQIVSKCEVPCERDACEKALKYAYDLGFDEGYQAAFDEIEAEDACDS